MSILSIEFIGFVAVALLFCYAVPIKARWIALLLFSLVLYALSGPFGLFYLLSVAGVTYLSARGIRTLGAKEQAAFTSGDAGYAKKLFKIKKALLVFAMLLCFCAMILIKYFDTLRGALNALLQAAGSGQSVPAQALLVPLGLSYFTFQSVGYLIDCYRGKCEAERNPLKYLLFVSFFPQMVQGPISSYGQLAKQLFAPARFSEERFRSGALLAIFGYFKKLVIADRLSPLTEALVKNPEQAGPVVLICVMLYAIRLYADFSGGMDVIRGVARMLGIDMISNFQRPFFSTSVAEYWRRWHISLGLWFRSYLFYPLVTSRFGLALSKLGQGALGKKVGRALPGAVSTFIIFLAIGMWHAVNWNAMIYGAYFGLLMGASMLFEPAFKAIRKKLGTSDRHFLLKGLRMVRTWGLVLVAQCFAFTNGPGQAVTLLKRIGVNWRFPSAAAQLSDMLPPLEWAIAGIAIAVLLLVDILCESGVDVCDRLAQKPIAIRWPVMIALIVVILVFGYYGEGFDSAAFLYTQF